MTKYIPQYKRARAKALSPKDRKEIAVKAAQSRWKTGESPDMELNMSELSLLKKELFGNPDSAISDIKFYPGSSRESSTEEIAGIIRASIDAIRTGNCRDIDLSI